MNIFELISTANDQIKEYLAYDPASFDGSYGKDYENANEATELLDNWLVLLEKGYSLNKDPKDIFKEYDRIEDVPDASSEWLQKAQETIAERIKLAKLETRISIFLCTSDDVDIWQAYNELEKSISGEEYDDSKVIPWEPFENMTYQEIYDQINNGLRDWK